MTVPSSFVSRLAVSLSLVPVDQRILVTGDFHAEAQALLESGREMVLESNANTLETTCFAISSSLCIHGATFEFGEEVVEFFRNERNGE